MQQPGGGAGRNPAAGPTPGRSSSSSSMSASPSPSSPSSTVSTPRQRQQQQLAFRQSLQQQQQQQPQQPQPQQQQLRKSERNEVLLAYQAGGLHGIMGMSSFSSPSTSLPLPPQPRMSIDFSQQSGPSYIHEENHNKGKGSEQHGQNLVHQAHFQCASPAAQLKSHGNMQSQLQGKRGMVGPVGKEQELRWNNVKMQELVSIQASNLASNQAKAFVTNKSVEHFMHEEKQMEQRQASGEQQDELKSPSQVSGHVTTANVIRPVQSQQAQSSMQNVANNPFLMAQLRAMQAWALEHKIDLSVPANANLIPQLLPLWQAKMAASQNPNENTRLPAPKQQILSPSQVGGDNLNPPNDLSSQVVSGKARPTLPSGTFPAAGIAPVVKADNTQMQHQLVAQSRENQTGRIARQSSMIDNGVQAMPMAPPQLSVSMSQSIDQLHGKNACSGSEMLQVQYLRQVQQLNQTSSQLTVSSNKGAVSGSHLPSQGGSLIQVPQKCLGFTKQQLHVLKAQILAFRRLKRGEGTLPQEVLQAIAPPPINFQLQQALPSPDTVSQDRTTGKNVEEHTRDLEATDKASQLASLSNGHSLIREEAFTREEKAAAAASHSQQVSGAVNEPVLVGSVGKEEKSMSSVKSEQEVERGNQKVSNKDDFSPDREPILPPQSVVLDAVQVKKPAPTNTPAPPKDAGLTRKYYGPLFDFSPFIRRNDSLGLTTNGNCVKNLTLAYDVKDLLFEEGKEMLSKRRTENMQKIVDLLAMNLERKWIKPDLVLRMQIEERKLRLLYLQERLRDEVEQQQQEIIAMADRPYRKFVRQCERQRMELIKQVQLSQKVMRERQLKSIFQWRKKLLEVHWVIRDARTTCNRGVAKYHERMLKEFAKRKDDDRNKRMEALKNNDVDRYREMLLEQQTNIPGDAGQRYSVLSSFLSQTEEYLHKLGGKITAAKSHQEVEEAVNAAAAAARSQGLTEEEVRAAAACAGEEVMIRNRFSEMNAPRDCTSVNKYYNLAHAVNERVIRQPSMLRAGTLRDYQLVGLQWMLSLYNNKLNGILADEMGLGKTVQVMALLAYLMEFKGNYGPHLIIVPNAVMVNWKSELYTWLPSASCIFYVGGKEQRSKLFSQEVCALKFNILVTTYEFVMYDRAKLSRIDWKYIVIDEAQRMKDRESVLARDLDRYRCQRRLLLTGTPLQNDLKELWSLLNLLLPDVFDSSKAFNDWFSKPFQKEGPPHNAEDDWLETEKKVIIIHRLHQILEPFMLRRRVEDVEGALPPKVPIVLRCRMSAIQGAIYDWIKSTGTIRVDPEDELRRAEKNPAYQVKTYKTLNNKCMELRKACNHPLLNYPYYSDLSKEFIVRSCGKLWILDRILIKLQRTGHRVLLFSTMTKLLDLLEEYLQWRRLLYRRIDGSTSLEDRESAIVDFNSPETNCFIFLLSIRAAGRGLNLQTADTVIIYDPDPNPKNEEQAVARAHRIGQMREVRVIYMEAVVDKIPSYQKEDEIRSGVAVDLEDDLAGKDRYMGSIESLIRNNIQQYKIDMADEVINAGRFDQRTTHEERRLTLETLLHDEERYQETLHDVPSLQEVNRMIARSEDEVELFDQMDEDLDWVREMTKYNEVPEWLRAGTREVNSVIANLSKKPSKATFVGDVGMEPNKMFLDRSPTETERKRGRPRASSLTKKYSVYLEMDDEDGDDFEASSEERDEYSLNEEEREAEEYEDEEFSGAADIHPSSKDNLEDDGLVCDDNGYGFPQAFESTRNNCAFEEAASSGSSSGSRRLVQIVTPSISSQKFGSLSALDAKPISSSRRMVDELEEGEIAASGDSRIDFQQSGSWTHDKDDAEDEQVLQPKIKRKRSIRIRPRYNLDRLEDKSNSEKLFLQGSNSSRLPSQNEHKGQFAIDQEPDAQGDPVAQKHSKHGQSGSVSKHGRDIPSKKVANLKSHVMLKSTRLNSLPGPAEDANDHSRESWNGKPLKTSGSVSFGTKMSGIVQRKCKNVTSKFQRRIKKDGNQIAPLLTDFWRTKNSYMTMNNLLDLQRIDERVDRLEYNGVMDYIADVQLMLKGAAQYHGHSHEVRLEARKLQDLFFDIARIAFPDTDIQGARKALSFPGLAASSPALKETIAGQIKQHKLVNAVERTLGPTKPSPHGRIQANDEVRGRGRPPKFQKESKRTNSSGHNHGMKDRAPLLTHPGDLVICKKKRKDRDKSLTPRSGPISPVNLPQSARNPFQKGPKPVQQATQAHGRSHQPSQRSDVGSEFVGVKEAQWAKPVKKMRTDAGKRRPSHL